ncbi:MAG: hybrid sensor histidine kinase/response regulator [Anaerolineae bacterium]|nr:hybrid sensor histidine kinase/response regulator [Anaerolineae bacterium]
MSAAASDAIASESTGSADLQELRRPIRSGLCLVVLSLTWIWIAAEMTVQGVPPRLEPGIPPAIMMVSATVTLLATGLPERWRTGIFLLGMGSALAVGYYLSGNPVWVFYQSLVVSVSLLLAGPAVSAVLAAGLTAFALAASREGSAQSALLVVHALGLLWATLAISWLSSTNLYTVLRWAMESQARAWRTATEVTRRREQLRRTLDSLRHAHAALSRTTRELEEARLEAEESRRVKARFLSNISHELRTPLNIIVGFAEILCFSPETYGDFPWPASLRDDLMTIWRNAEHLLQMIDDVLDLAQIEAARLPVMPEPTDLGQLIRDTAVTASGLLKDSRLDLRVRLPGHLPMLELDRTRVRQVLLNLINNAVRATREGFIEVSAFASEEQVTVCVRDSGEGIPPDRLEVIFEEFEQVDTSLRRPHQGVGLGLAICRQFIRLHGGRIWAESTPGQGSAFYFSLPLPGRRGAMQPPVPRRAWPQRPQGREDRASVVVLCRDQLVGRVLERHAEEVEVLRATTVEEAASLVRERHPDMVFVAVETTIGASEYSGRPLEEAAAQARELLALAAPAELPALVAGFPTERRAGAALGVEEFLIKPVTPEQVVTVVRRLCGDPGRLLLVDDEADMLALLERIVHKEWPQVETLAVSSGEEALAALDGFRPQAILLDLLMPGMGGVEFLARMKARDMGVHPPVAVVTARGPAQDLSALGQAEMRLIRNAGLTAGEMVRVLESLAKALPARYVGGDA